MQSDINHSYNLALSLPGVFLLLIIKYASETFLGSFLLKQKGRQKYQKNPLVGLWTVKQNPRQRSSTATSWRRKCQLELPPILIPKWQIGKKCGRKPMQRAKVAGRDLEFYFLDLLANLRSICNTNIRHRRKRNVIQEYEIAFWEFWKKEKNQPYKLSFQKLMPTTLFDSFLNT